MKRLSETNTHLRVQMILVSGFMALLFLGVGFWFGRLNTPETPSIIESKELLIPEFYLRTDGINVDTIFVYKI